MAKKKGMNFSDRARMEKMIATDEETTPESVSNFLQVEVDVVRGFWPDVEPEIDGYDEDEDEDED